MSSFDGRYWCDSRVLDEHRDISSGGEASFSLMSSLEKFATLARPDKILMVGEALVGTDSVSQASQMPIPIATIGTSQMTDTRLRVDTLETGGALFISAI